MRTPFIDEHGFLRGFPYHDGLLQAVVFADGRASLQVRSTDGVTHVIELRDLTAFSADGVCEGNIVLNMRVLEPARVAEDPDLRMIVKDKLHVDPAALSEKRQLVFYLESSFGAEVLALCSHWTVVRGTFVLKRT